MNEVKEKVGKDVISRAITGVCECKEDNVFIFGSSSIFIFFISVNLGHEKVPRKIDLICRCET